MPEHAHPGGAFGAGLPPPDPGVVPGGGCEPLPPRPSFRRLAAFPTVRERARREAGVQVGLVLVGDGPLGPGLRSRCEAGELPGVHLAGWLEGPELARAFASADVFAFPSDTETFGNVVLEAMASGLPVVGVNRGGVRDSVRSGRNGLLVPPGDEDGLVDGLLRLSLDPGLRGCMGTVARSDALERSWARILDGVIDVYREAA
ncbi:MAG: glycosyltransferase [Gemmatimonadales bacterium]|nr:MAG: glycosyltransferase [Gemmatimonadales bacterium]